MRQPLRKKGRVGNRGETAEVYDKIHGHKVGTPIGGGILFSLVYILGFWFISNYFGFVSPKTRLLIIGATLFGIFGFSDDFRKTFRIKSMGLRVRYQFLIEFSMAAFLTYFALENGLFHLTFLGLPITNYAVLFAISVFAIVFVVNAFNITDGADGLSSGLYLITLSIFFIIFNAVGANIELVYISIIFGVLLAYLYFNIRPARVYMGDTGSFSLGVALAILLLMNNLLWLFLIFGVVYIVELGSSFLQIFSIKFRKKRIFKIAPLHHFFEAIGWEEDKVVFRFWVLHAFLSLLALGVFFAVL